MDTEKARQRLASLYSDIASEVGSSTMDIVYEIVELELLLAKK